MNKVFLALFLLLIVASSGCLGKIKYCQEQENILLEDSRLCDCKAARGSPENVDLDIAANLEVQCRCECANENSTGTYSFLLTKPKTN